MEKQAFKKFYDSFKLSIPELKNSGHLADYIPELAKVNPALFSVCLTRVDGEVFSFGDDQVEFTLQSTSKPFMYGFALNEKGSEFVETKVGIEPSGEAFNSIIELERKTHRPFNPMINSGAIAIAHLIQDQPHQNRQERMIQFFSKLAQRPLTTNNEVFHSEKKTAHRNRAIAHLLRHFNVIGDDIEETLDLYFQQCSLNVNVKDLSMMAAVLANKGQHPISQQQCFTAENNQKILSLMLTCGMYDTAGEWAYRVGLPSKSGVSGALLTVVPHQFALAVYSPLINQHGHSVLGIKFTEKLIRELKINLF